MSKSTFFKTAKPSANDSTFISASKRILFSRSNVSDSYVVEPPQNKTSIGQVEGQVANESRELTTARTYMLQLLGDGRDGSNTSKKIILLSKESLENAIADLAQPIDKLTVLEDAFSMIVNNSAPNSENQLYTPKKGNIITRGYNLLKKDEWLTETQLKHLKIVANAYLNVLNDNLKHPSITNLFEKATNSVLARTHIDNYSSSDERVKFLTRVYALELQSFRHSQELRSSTSSLRRS